jgi:hypothetical protein
MPAESAKKVACVYQGCPQVPARGDMVAIHSITLEGFSWAKV